MTSNKVTKLYPNDGITIGESDIQGHFDEMNADGWILTFVENFGGWYRFFWTKTS